MPAFLSCGFCSGKYYHTKFPDIFHARKDNINILEKFAIIICLNYGEIISKGRNYRCFVICRQFCHVINTGKSKCTILHYCLREIAFLAACNEFQIRMVHLSSECNRLSDHLSRWDLDISHRQKFFDLVKGQTVTESIVSQDLFHLTHTWLCLFFLDKQLKTLKDELKTSRKKAYADGTAKKIKNSVGIFFTILFSFWLGIFTSKYRNFESIYTIFESKF